MTIIYLWKPLIFCYLNCAFTYESEFNRIEFHSKTHYTERKGVLKPLCNQGLNILLLKPTISPLVTHYVSDKGLWLLFSEVSFFINRMTLRLLSIWLRPTAMLKKLIVLSTWIETNTMRVNFYFMRWISFFSKIAAIIIAVLLLARFFASKQSSVGKLNIGFIFVND